MNSVCMVHDRDNVHCDVCVGEIFSQSSFVNSNGGIAEAKVSNPSNHFCQCVCSGGEVHTGDQLVEGIHNGMGQVATETLANQELPSVLSVSVGVDKYSKMCNACHWEAHRRKC